MREDDLVAWMLANGFATGHGDTTTDILDELTWQVAEREDRAYEHGMLFGWNCAVETAEELQTGTWGSPQSAKARESARVRRAERFNAALKSRRKQRQHSR